MKHKHAELIKAWADGAEIQFKAPDDDKFRDCLANPAWENDDEYRIKPEPKSDYVMYLAKTEGKWLEFAGSPSLGLWDAKLKLTFDGETGELKSAEVLHDK